MEQTKMKYYQVAMSSEPKIIGVNNGVYQVELDKRNVDTNNEEYQKFIEWFNYDNPDFWTKQEVVQTLKSPVIKSILLKKAKITDLMSYAPQYHCLYNIYSEKFINILKAFNIGDYSLFDFEIKDVSEKYYLMFIKTIPSSELIYDKSIIYTGNKFLNNVKYLPVNNYQDYLDLNKDEGLLTNFEKITISKEHYGKDIIEVQVTSKPYYSEKLVDFLLDCGITGLEIKYNNTIELEFV
ncbi:hypothetical protein [Flavobacterium sp. NRK F7]|uniref:hypothetical protein n=1 Tax=Flavobacterium sp. NRK F7 TaxID=2954930 RepID=UPI002090C609|nr:hypothetical protein [Flavobacterium sp. NRK F7]MCO6164496.1 hypothetical protein [Flavobacterium sp. NRK F7]